MKIPIAHTPEGIEILLTDEHPVCLHHTLPCVAVGDGPGARACGKADLVRTDQGQSQAGRLVIEWLESGPERTKESRALAMRFLKDVPDYL